jgi:hypothetical protein
MFKVVEVKALPEYRLWLRFMDGTEGEVDLSEFAGRGVFKLWNDYSVFEQVHIGGNGEVVWNEEIDLGPDSLYLRMTGKAPRDVFTKLSEARCDA